MKSNLLLPITRTLFYEESLFLYIIQGGRVKKNQYSLQQECLNMSFPVCRKTITYFIRYMYAQKLQYRNEVNDSWPQYDIEFRTNKPSDQWAFGLMKFGLVGLRTNEPSD